MSDKNTIETAEDAELLPVGQWVIDADGEKLCLVDTHLGFPQRMWMGTGRRLRRMYSLGMATYPVRLGDLPEDFECPHTWGVNECGHCYACGEVTGARREMFFDEVGSATFHAAALNNARIDAEAGK